MNKEFDQWLKDTGKDIKYTGDYELSLEEFPMVENFTKEGKASNILTQYFSVAENPDEKFPAVLVPSMHKGDWRNEKDMRHFGIYETKDELDKIDKAIHEWFDFLSTRKSIPVEKDIINNLKRL